VRIVVTTALGASPGEETGALASAGVHGFPYQARLGRPVEAILAASGAGAALVLGRRRAALWLDGHEHPWHGGMGELRLRRLERGEAVTRDAFLEAAALRPGDVVLDATLGLGMDALVAAGAVGAGGRVLGVEASPALAALVAEGLSRHPSPAARRVQVIAGQAGDALARMAAGSVDVIAFDPMFRHPPSGGAGIDLLRRLGSPEPLSPETLARAREVARRHVIVKDGAPGWDLARLGLPALPSARGAKRLYARLAAGG
jgi:16S rRNA (guanine1516-N2)-methyltransferase